MYNDRYYPVGVSPPIGVTGSMPDSQWPTQLDPHTLQYGLPIPQPPYLEMIDGFDGNYPELGYFPPWHPKYVNWVNARSQKVKEAREQEMIDNYYKHGGWLPDYLKQRLNIQPKPKKENPLIPSRQSRMSGFSHNPMSPTGGAMNMQQGAYTPPQYSDIQRILAGMPKDKQHRIFQLASMFGLNIEQYVMQYGWPTNDQLYNGPNGMPMTNADYQALLQGRNMNPAPMHQPGYPPVNQGYPQQSVMNHMQVHPGFSNVNPNQIPVNMQPVPTLGGSMQQMPMNVPQGPTLGGARQQPPMQHGIYQPDVPFIQVLTMYPNGDRVVLLHNGSQLFQQYQIVPNLDMALSSGQNRSFMYSQAPQSGHNDIPESVRQSMNRWEQRPQVVHQVQPIQQPAPVAVQQPAMQVQQPVVTQQFDPNDYDEDDFEVVNPKSYRTLTPNDFLPTGGIRLEKRLKPGRIPKSQRVVKEEPKLTRDQIVQRHADLQRMGIEVDERNKEWGNSNLRANVIHDYQPSREGSSTAPKTDKINPLCMQLLQERGINIAGTLAIDLPFVEGQLTPTFVGKDDPFKVIDPIYARNTEELALSLRIIAERDRLGLGKGKMQFTPYKDKEDFHFIDTSVGNHRNITPGETEKPAFQHPNELVTRINEKQNLINASRDKDLTQPGEHLPVVIEDSNAADEWANELISHVCTKEEQLEIRGYAYNPNKPEQGIEYPDAAYEAKLDQELEMLQLEQPDDWMNTEHVKNMCASSNVVKQPTRKQRASVKRVTRETNPEKFIQRKTLTLKEGNEVDRSKHQIVKFGGAVSYPLAPKFQELSDSTSKLLVSPAVAVQPEPIVTMVAGEDGVEKPVEVPGPEIPFDEYMIYPSIMMQTSLDACIAATRAAKIEHVLKQPEDKVFRAFAVSCDMILSSSDIDRYLVRLRVCSSFSELVNAIKGIANEEFTTQQERNDVLLALAEVDRKLTEKTNDFLRYRLGVTTRIEEFSSDILELKEHLVKYYKDERMIDGMDVFHRELIESLQCELPEEDIKDLKTDLRISDEVQVGYLPMMYSFTHINLTAEELGFDNNAMKDNITVITRTEHESLFKLIHSLEMNKFARKLNTITDYLITSDGVKYRMFVNALADDVFSIAKGSED